MNDLHNINRRNLIEVREAIKTNPDKACATYNIDSEFASVLVHMPLSEIDKVADTNVELFHPSIFVENTSQQRSL